jgi:2-dehydro-3-deoxyphosphogluconate aldolase/(4S)-4-hydroxy-2-oxoglutarate aldolase
VEITYRDSAATRVIATIRRALPELLVLAGTVLDLDQLHAAVAAGAEIIVSPVLDPVLVAAARAVGIAVVPGVATPSEVGLARRLGSIS